MRFSFKQFRQVLTEATPKEISDYLQFDLAQALRDLQAGLRRMTLEENFESFQVTETLPANTEVKIRNELRTKVPSGKFIIRGGVNSHLVTDGVAEWDLNFVTLKNSHASALTVTVVFFA